MMVTPTEFAKMVGVSKPAVSRAIKIGRVPIYDETGVRVPPTHSGKKFINSDEAALTFRVSQVRIDDGAAKKIAAEIERDIEADVARVITASPAGQQDLFAPSLVDAKIEKERLQAELLRLRLARERGEMVMRSAQLSAFESAGRNVARAAQAMPTWAEDLNAAAHRGGVREVTSWLRAKATEFCNSVADVLAAEGDESYDASDDDAN